VNVPQKVLGALAACALAVIAGAVGEAGAAYAAPAGSTVPSTVARQAVTDPNTCSIQTIRGFYVTAVGGGGRDLDVMHTNATVFGSWERFTLVYTGDGIHYGLRTVFGYYVTAVNSGGLAASTVPDVLHTDATQLLNWEKFTIIAQGDGTYAIRAFDGHYLSARDGGGRVARTFDSNVTQVQSWEKFRFTCNV
jgi:hypothetical protein